MAESQKQPRDQRVLITTMSILLISVNLLMWFYSQDDDKPSPPTQPESSSPRSTEKPVPTAAPALPRIDHPILVSSARFQLAETDPAEDIEILSAVIETYRRDFGGNPIGENEEIFAALRGENPKGLLYLPSEIPGLQATGVVLDRWGTPWRFHALSGTNMEVDSAGPDGTFGNADDLSFQ
jgi:hypothetical protein